MTLRRRVEQLEKVARAKASEEKWRPWRMVDIRTDGMYGPPLNEEEAAKLAAAEAAADSAGERLAVVYLPVGEGEYDGPAT